MIVVRVRVIVCVLVGWFGWFGWLQATERQWQRDRCRVFRGQQSKLGIIEQQSESSGGTGAARKVQSGRRLLGTMWKKEIHAWKKEVAPGIKASIPSGPRQRTLKDFIVKGALPNQPPSQASKSSFASKNTYAVLGGDDAVLGGEEKENRPAFTTHKKSGNLNYHAALHKPPSSESSVVKLQEANGKRPRRDSPTSSVPPSSTGASAQKKRKKSGGGTLAFMVEIGV